MYGEVKNGKSSFPHHKRIQWIFSKNKTKKIYVNGKIFFFDGFAHSLGTLA